MFKTDIENLVQAIKKEMLPNFDNVYFRHSWELNGIDDSKQYLAYISYSNEKETVPVQKGAQTGHTFFQVKMKAVFQFPTSVDFDSVLQKAFYCISTYKMNGVNIVVESFMLDSSQIIKNETNVNSKKEIPLILINFVLRKSMLVASCGPLCENECK